MFDADLELVHAELQHLGFSGARPKYEFYAEKSAPLSPDDPQVLAMFRCCFGLKLDGKSKTEVSWYDNLYRSSDVSE